MGIAKELLKRARLLEARQEQKAARLEREAEKCEEIAPEKLAAAKVARTAHKRLLQFSPYLGSDLRCPDCFAIGTESTLKPSIRTFVTTGDNTFDEFRCRACGYELSVRA